MWIGQASRRARSVNQIQSGQKPMKSITDRVRDEVPVATYVSYSSAIMIPENAGGNALATTSILRLSGSIWNINPSISTTAGIITILSMDPSAACQLMVNFMAESVMPAEKTAIEAFALAIRSNDGLAHLG